jgi:putative ATPase
MESFSRTHDHKTRDYISQDHLIGPNGSLTQQIRKELSLHWYCGGLREQEETTLAQIIAQNQNVRFIFWAL